MSIMHQRRIFKKEAIFEPDTNSTSKQSSAKSHEKRGLLARSQATRKLCFSGERRQSFEYEIKQNNNFSVGKDQENARILFRQMPEEENEERTSHMKRFTHRRSNNQPCLLKIRQMKLPSTVNSITRVILIDWLSQVAEEQQISKEALHRAIFYLDKLTATVGISKKEYQFYGLTCLFISHKLDTRKALSYNIASFLVEGSIEQWKFEEYEEKIIRQLTFKLHPFTLWVQMNMLLEGFKQFVGNYGGLDCELIYKKALWVVEGYVISHSYKSDKYPRPNICLSILFRVVVSSTSNSNFYNSLLSFCKNIQQSFGSNEENEDKQIIYWINRFSDSFGSSEAYNSQLKRLAPR